MFADRNEISRDIRLTTLRTDLRVPIGLIVESCELLLDDREGSSAAFRSDLEKIHRAGRQLLDMVDDILDPRANEERDLDLESSRSKLRHDLRTPLNHIIGYAEMVLEDLEDQGDPGDSLSADLDKIRSAGLGLLERIDVALAAPDTTEDAGGDGNDIRVADMAATLEGLVGFSRRSQEPLAGKVLIVDDDETNRDVLSRRVSAEGADVVIAGSGAEAIEILKRESFDTVLLDIIMPGMSGVEVLERLKMDPELMDIPVIMISALDEIESTVRCIELGAEDYLPKPFNPTLLRARLGASIDKKRLRDREITYLKMIEEEKKRSDDLLHAIFPAEIVKELKETQTVRPRRYENVAVLFSDIVGFTRYSDRREPEQVITNLQRLVQSQEELAARHEMNKIKTIGDAFMAAAGLLKPVENPVRNCVRFALDMLEAVGELQPDWQLRVGIHTGPLVGGVLGRRQYLFDLIGDTVNIASRVEERGQPGSITLSGSAWDRISTEAEGESLGKVALKGKGELDLIRFQRFV